MNSTNQPPKRTPFEIFNGALDLPDSAELKAYLDRACQGDAALRAQVENLLTHHHSDSFLEHAALAAAAVGETPTTLDPTREAAPASVAPLGNIKYFGDYELLEEIARGATLAGGASRAGSSVVGASPTTPSARAACSRKLSWW